MVAKREGHAIKTGVAILKDLYHYHVHNHLSGREKVSLKFKTIIKLVFV